MTRFSLASLRVRLLLLVLLAVLPALGLTLYSGLERRWLAATEAQEEALRLARLAAAYQERLIEGARQLLVALAQLPLVRDKNPATCSAFFLSLLKQYQSYTNFAVMTPDGEVVCSAVPTQDTVNVADQAFFRRAQERRDFAVGGYLIDSITGSPVTMVVYPVLDEADQVAIVISASLDLGWLNQFAAQAQLPPGSTFSVRDRNGTLLIRHPNPEQWIGQSVPESPITQAILARQEEGTVEAAGLDGVLRLYAFTLLRDRTEINGYATVGIPAKSVYAKADRLLVRNLTWLGLVTVLAFAAAWFGSDVFLLRRVDALLGVTQRLAAGDLGVRRGPPYGKGELEHLARTFDDMAEALAQREAERKRAEETLRRLATVVRDSNDAITVQAFDGQILAWNRGAEQMNGHTEAEALKMNIRSIIPETKQEEAQVLAQRLSRGESLESFETQRVTKDGRILDVWLTITILVDDTGKPIAIATTERDITARKRAEEALKQHATELEAANKELEAFSYSVSHDLRAPLRAVDGFSRILLEDYASHLAPDAQRYLQIVRNNAQQMGHLIDDLLTFSRLSHQPLKTQLVAPADIARQAFAGLRHEQEGRRVEVAIGDLPACQADPALLKQVFVNLLANALKFTRQREVAYVEVGCTSPPTPPLPGDGREGGCVYFVQDNGVGFDIQYAHKLFGVFQRLHRAEEYEGTGVGLAIVQRIIHRHGGRVWAEAEVGKGATFYFTMTGGVHVS